MSKPVIICVDDEKIILDSLEEQLLREFGDKYRLEIAESGEEGLEIIEELVAQNALIPILISDQLMPSLKGDEFLIKAHRLIPDTHKILLTGQAGAEAIGNAVNNANLYRYIGKPWEKSDLLLTVQEAVRSYLQNLEIAEKNKALRDTNKAFEKFVPRGFLKYLDKRKITEFRLGDGIEKEMTVLFSDMRSFTSISEHMTPMELFSFLNRYLGDISPIIRKHGGFVVTYIGDAIMALFPEDSESAIKCGVEMQGALHKYNQPGLMKGQEPVRIGIGINTGNVLLGIIGESERWEGAAISEVVNIASRLESLTKICGASIIVSKTTLDRIQTKEKYSCLSLGNIIVRGKSEPLQIYEIYDGELPEVREFKSKIKNSFEEGLRLYQNAEFTKAREYFRKNLEHNGMDRASFLYLEKCEYYIQIPPPPEWDGSINPLIK